MLSKNVFGKINEIIVLGLCFPNFMLKIWFKLTITCNTIQSNYTCSVLIWHDNVKIITGIRIITFVEEYAVELMLLHSLSCAMMRAVAEVIALFLS